MTKSFLNSVVVIPARFESTRFPGKPLEKIDQKPMIQHVYEQASLARRPSEVIVATDDKRIKLAVESFGGAVKMTAKTHQSGTERIAEIIPKLDTDLVVNVQADEPLIDPASIDAAIEPFDSDPELIVSTIKSLATQEELKDSNVVKVVTDHKGYALYFSRSSIPFHKRNNEFQDIFFKHIGLYVYHKIFFDNFSKLLKCELEQLENLEQLRFLYNGYRIKVIHYESKSIGVDTPEDLVKVKRILEKGSKKLADK